MLLGLVSQANPPSLDKVEDLVDLVHLNESSTLHVLRQRYGSSIIHTFAGNHLVVLNPLKPLSSYVDRVSRTHGYHNTYYAHVCIEHCSHSICTSVFTLYIYICSVNTLVQMLWEHILYSYNNIHVHVCIYNIYIYTYYLHGRWMSVYFQQLFYMFLKAFISCSDIYVHCIQYSEYPSKQLLS